MAKFGGSGNDANMGETRRFLERQGSAGGGKAGAYQIERGVATPPSVKNSTAGAPSPSHSADKPGV